MAGIALNKFRTIRIPITTNSVGIYTCPVGVSAIVILSQVINISTGVAKSTYTVTASHSRPSESPTDYVFANRISIPPNDGLNLISDGRLVLETSDIIKIVADTNNVLNLVLSILETAKQ